MGHRCVLLVGRQSCAGYDCRSKGVTFYVHQEQGLRRHGGNDPGRGRRRCRRVHRGDGRCGHTGCGDSCLDLFSHTFGDYPQPNFLLDTFRQGEKVGQPVILFRMSNTDPAEDFTVALEGLVSDLNTAGLVSKALDLHYGGAGCEDYDPTTAKCVTFYPDDEALEIEYSPFGVDSGLCVGTATTAVNGTEVSLQPCGVTAKTTWILDVADAIGIPPTPPRPRPRPDPDPAPGPAPDPRPTLQ